MFEVGYAFNPKIEIRRSRNLCSVKFELANSIWKRSWNSLENHDFSKGSFWSWKCFKNSIFQKSSCREYVSVRTELCLRLVMALRWKSRDTKYLGIVLASKVRSENPFESTQRICSKSCLWRLYGFHAKKAKKMTFLKNQVAGSMFWFELSSVWDWVWL